MSLNTLPVAGSKRALPQSVNTSPRKRQALELRNEFPFVQRDHRLVDAFARAMGGFPPHHAGRLVMPRVSDQKSNKQPLSNFEIAIKDFLAKKLVTVHLCDTNERILEVTFNRKTDEKGNSVLHFLHSLETEALLIYPLLCEQNVDPFQSNKKGKTALDLFCEWGLFNVVKALVDHPKCTQKILIQAFPFIVMGLKYDCYSDIEDNVFQFVSLFQERLGKIPVLKKSLKNELFSYASWHSVDFMRFLIENQVHFQQGAVDQNLMGRCLLRVIAYCNLEKVRLLVPHIVDLNRVYEGDFRNEDTERLPLLQACLIASEYQDEELEERSSFKPINQEIFDWFPELLFLENGEFVIHEEPDDLKIVRFLCESGADVSLVLQQANVRQFSDKVIEILAQYQKKTVSPA